MSKSLLRVTALMWVVAGLAACGGGGSPTEGPPVRAALASPPPAPSPPPPPPGAIAGTDGLIYATASADGKTLYIGGDFSRAGMPTGSFVPVDAETGAVAAHQIVNGNIDAQIPDGTGGWYIAGSFTKVGSTSQAHIAHIKADGSLDRGFKPMAEMQVMGLARYGSSLYLGGCMVAGMDNGRCFVKSVDTLTGTVAKWVVETVGGVRKLAVRGRSLYLGGYFQKVAGTSRSYLAALDTVTGAVLAWNPHPADGAGTPYIHAIVPSDTAVYVGGEFQTIGGATRTSLAAVDTSSGHALAWNAGIGPLDSVTDVRALVLQGAKLYVGGTFAAAGGQPRGGLAVLDATTAHALPWDAGLTLDQYTMPTVNALAVNPERVFIGGQFVVPGSPAVRRSASFDKVSAASLPWLNAGPTSSIAQLGVADSHVFVGGTFSLLAGATRRHLAAIDLATGAVTGWNPDAPSTDGDTSTGVVRQLLVRASTIYAGGTFTRIGGVDRQGLAALNNTTGAATSWNPKLDGEPTTLSASPTRLYVGGIYITSVNGQPRKGLAAFDLPSGQLTTWAPDVSGASALRLLATSTTVYLGGAFSTINGQTRNGLATLDPTTGKLLPWNPDVRSPLDGYNISGMALGGDALYIAGEFRTVGGQSRFGLAAVNATSGAVLPWQPTAMIHPRGVTVRGDRVYVGQMQGGGDPPAQAVTTLSISQNAVVDTDYVVEGWVESILAANGHLYFAGQFTGPSGGMALNLADYLR